MAELIRVFQGHLVQHRRTRECVNYGSTGNVGCAGHNNQGHVQGPGPCRQSSEQDRDTHRRGEGQHTGDDTAAENLALTPGAGLNPPMSTRSILMTGEEEAVLKEYLHHNGAIGSDQEFEDWYLSRYVGEENEVHYKNILHLAQVWKRRYEEGYRAGLAAVLETGG